MRAAALFTALVPVLAALASCVGDDPTSGPPATPADGGGDATSGPTPDSGGGGDSGGANDGGDVDSGALVDIDGDVVDLFGNLVADAKVRVGATTVTTGGDGHFHFALVPATYDLDVVSPGPGGQKEITSFRGLTTRSPKANVNHAVSSVVKTTSFAGTFSSPLSYTTNEHLKITDTEQYFGFAQPTVLSDPSAGSSFSGGTAVWFGNPATPLTIWSYKFIAPTVGSNPTAFTGFYRSEIQVTAGTPVTNYNVMLAAGTSTATLTGTVVSLPPGAATATVLASFKLSADTFGSYFHETTNVTNAFSIATPTGANMVVNVIAEAGSSSGPITHGHKVWKANAAPNATGVALTFGTPPSFATPADAATGVTNATAFTWTAGSPAGVYMLTITCGTGATGYRVTLFTTATSATPTDASALGADWPTGASCTWDLTLYGKATTVNTMAVANARNRLDRPIGPVDGILETAAGYGFSTPM
jgi:hypothetical protein